MGLGRDYVGQECALATALELVGERWTLLVVRDAFYGVRRYSDFLTHLGAPRAVLAARLQALVDAGVLEKRLYRDSPARSEYLLTDTGKALWAAVYALAHWSETHLSPGGARRQFFHVPCGGALAGNGSCSACGVDVRPEDVEMRPGPGARPNPRDDAVTRALQQPRRLLEPLVVGGAAAATASSSRRGTAAP